MELKEQYSERIIGEGLTFDDVLLVPAESDILPADVDLTTYLTNGEKQTLEAEKDANVNGINLPATNGYFNEIRYFTDCVLAGKDCDKVKPEELECVLDLIDIIDGKAEA